MDHRCGFLISQIKIITSRLLDRTLEEHNIAAFSGAQGRILDILWQKDGIPVRDISRETGLSMPTLTGMLDRMETSSLVSRQPDPNDRRKLRIVLTDKARELDEEYKKISRDMDEIFMNGFSEEETELLQSFLKRILNNLQEAEEAKEK